MDSQTDAILFHLLTAQRIASLGTLRGGIPNVSMVLFAASPDFQHFYLHMSRLAQHTQDLLSDPRAGLMVSEPDERMKSLLPVFHARPRQYAEDAVDIDQIAAEKHIALRQPQPGVARKMRMGIRQNQRFPA